MVFLLELGYVADFIEPSGSFNKAVYDRPPTIGRALEFESGQDFFLSHVVEEK
jgi:hypothetical protein